MMKLPEISRPALLSALLLGAGLVCYLTVPPMPACLPARMLRWYGPDFLWAASFTLAVQAVVGLRGRDLARLCLCGLPGVLFEYGQRCGLFRGTADAGDVAVYFLGAAAAAVLIKITEERK